jgi:hypothetical protein
MDDIKKEEKPKEEKSNGTEGGVLHVVCVQENGNFAMIVSASRGSR